MVIVRTLTPTPTPASEPGPHPATTTTTITATPLTREAFARFGAAVSNPAPAQLPHNTPPASIAAGALPCGAASANQGSAIQYRDLCAVRDLYPRAPSGAAARPRLTMFVCGARELQTRQGQGEGSSSSSSSSSAEGGDGVGAGAGAGAGGKFFEVGILERHPFTTQTFAPLGVDPAGPRRYLVVVAPSLPPSALDADLPAPALPPPPPSSSSSDDGDGGDEGGLEQLPGRGLPDLRNLRAFVARGDQAVTYGAGTWHAPMVALGPPGSAIDFVVTQFANGVPVEDCQEVVLRRRRRRRRRATKSSGSGDGEEGENQDRDDGSSGIWVRIPDDDDNDDDDDDDDDARSSRLSKL